MSWHHQPLIFGHFHPIMAFMLECWLTLTYIYCVSIAWRQKDKIWSFEWIRTLVFWVTAPVPFDSFDHSDLFRSPSNRNKKPERLPFLGDVNKTQIPNHSSSRFFVGQTNLLTSRTNISGNANLRPNFCWSRSIVCIRLLAKPLFVSNSIGSSFFLPCGSSAFAMEATPM